MVLRFDLSGIANKEMFYQNCPAFEPIVSSLGNSLSMNKRTRNKNVGEKIRSSGPATLIDSTERHVVRNMIQSMALSTDYL